LKNTMEVPAMKVEVVNIEKKIEEFVRKMEKEGYGVWFEDEEKIVLGKVLYEGGHNGELQDWEELTINKESGEVVRTYGTNRSVPGWSLCEACGEWYSYNEEGLHENCKPERFKL